MSHSTKSKIRIFEKVCKIIQKYEKNPAKLIPILQAVQAEYRYLPQEVMTFIATSLDIPPARVFGVATFFSHFALEPKGKHVIRVCDGTACHVKNSTGLIGVLQEKLKLTESQKTTTDMMFTLETVSCLGACGIAPVMVVDETVYGQVTPQQISQIIDQIIQSEGDAQ